MASEAWQSHPSAAKVGLFPIHYLPHLKRRVPPSPTAPGGSQVTWCSWHSQFSNKQEELLGCFQKCQPLIFLVSYLHPVTTPTWFNKQQQSHDSNSAILFCLQRNPGWISGFDCLRRTRHYFLFKKELKVSYFSLNVWVLTCHSQFCRLGVN